MLLGLGALAFTVWGVWSSFERTPKRYFETAEQKLRADDYLGAVQDYEKITEEYARSRWAPEAYFWVGVIYFLYLDDPPKAIRSLQKSIQMADLQPDHLVAARQYIAEIYQKKLNKPKEAIAEYEKIMQESPEPEQVLESQYKVGELYFDLGDFEQARTEWDLLVKKNPSSRWAPAALYRQGSTYFITGNCKEAVVLYQRLLTDYPEKELSHYYAKFDMANCLEEGQRLAEALQLYKELEGHYPNKDLLSSKIKRLEKSGGAVKEES
jgi:tetratricopeptide (TPR) repeat protein